VKNIPGLLDVVLLRRLPLDAGARFAVATISRYALVMAGVVCSFDMLGFGWSKLQWLVAAMSVGLGFGLQEIFANFVSGIIMLFERPIRINDIVTVGDIDGRVTRINMRATTITDFNRKELIVPNKEFITGRLVNWSLTDPIIRIMIPVGIAYGSDVDKAIRLLRQVAGQNEIVLDDPPPRAIFKEFGDNSLNLELYIHIPHRDLYLDVMHALHLAIDKAYREAGIEIPFPQRDVHLDASGPMDIRLVSDDEGSGSKDAPKTPDG